MNRQLLSLLALLAVANMAFGIVCSPNICDIVRCMEYSEENCEYTVVPNGGYCGCCNACVHLLKVGETCPTLHLKGGPPPTVKCEDGLVCNGQTGKCETA
ncbi:unnamed protein product [Candidula unifasciata]|uniref:Uncharacterized protein n=1 Tax=Candidula unifasciata TaxID=100452 RepID=A0A8S3YV80_9EUPU|nr:unnamed protein product [Candidula unifasciata]